MQKVIKVFAKININSLTKWIFSVYLHCEKKLMQYCIIIISLKFKKNYE